LKELFDILCKLFQTDDMHMCFYDTYGHDLPEPETLSQRRNTIWPEDAVNEDSFDDVTDMAQWNSPGEWAVSEFFLDNINALAYHTAFEYIPDFIGRQPDVLETKLLLDTVSPVTEHLKEDYVHAVVQEILPAFIKFLTSLTDKQLKECERRVVPEIIAQLDNMICHVDHEDTMHESIEQLKFTLAVKHFMCPYLQLRVLGLNDLSVSIKQINQKCSQIRGAGAQSSYMVSRRMHLTGYFRALTPSLPVYHLPPASSSPSRCRIKGQ
jgi:hypothetical protein